VMKIPILPMTARSVVISLNMNACGYVISHSFVVWWCSIYGNVKWSYYCRQCSRVRFMKAILFVSNYIKMIEVG